MWLSVRKHALQILIVFGGLTGLPFGPSSPGGPLAPAGPAAPGGPASPFSPLSPLGPYSGEEWQRTFTTSVPQVALFFLSALNWRGDKNWRAVGVHREKLDPKLISVCVTEDNNCEWSHHCWCEMILKCLHVFFQLSDLPDIMLLCLFSPDTKGQLNLKCSVCSISAHTVYHCTISNYKLRPWGDGW